MKTSPPTLDPALAKIVELLAEAVLDNLAGEVETTDAEDQSAD